MCSKSLAYYREQSTAVNTFYIVGHQCRTQAMNLSRKYKTPTEALFYLDENRLSESTRATSASHQPTDNIQTIQSPQNEGVAVLLPTSSSPVSADQTSLSLNAPRDSIATDLPFEATALTTGEQLAYAP